MPSQISVGTLIPKQKQTLKTRIAVKCLDTILGLSKMQKLYMRHHMQGLSKEEFSDRLLEALEVKVKNQQELIDKLPKDGPVVIASNHPFGGLEGVILARTLSKSRPDLKVLANFALEIFAELKEYFIFTNPLSERDPRNGPSLRNCMAHVKSGNAIMLFPAGRVSYYRKDYGRIAEHDWNRIVAKLITSGKAMYLPVFVEGYNTKKFYRAGRVYERLRMFFLGHELLNKRRQTIEVNAGNAISYSKLDKGNGGTEMAALCRALSYAVSKSWYQPWKPTVSSNFKPLAEPIAAEVIKQEIEALPSEQHLVSYKGFDVYFGKQAQLPNVVTEIARLRELVFREHDEGSGEPIDTDKFDATYTQLFIVERSSSKIIGAYRMGQSDELLEKGGVEQLYLSQMFEFKPDFYNQTEPCLEMGRSFIVPEHQKSFYGLFLLWRGIGAFACKFPRYRRLYGTVSLSKLYDKRSIAIIEKALVQPRDDVNARAPYSHELHPELQEFHTQYDLNNYLSEFLHVIEQDSKDIPVLLKHYMRIGAEFYALGVDPNFAETPGLLLCVDLTKLPQKQGKLYLDEGFEGYLEHHK